MYTFSKAGILAIKLLKEHLPKFGYSEIYHIPGLVKHETWLVWSTLRINAFGIKCIVNPHAEHPIWTLKQQCEMEVDWKGVFLL